MKRGTKVMWDAGQYLKYAEERSRPFFDLLARVRLEHAEFIADLGCGPGNLTRTLAERWPKARVVGVDSSPEMLEQARALAIPGRLDFVQGDIASWLPEKPADLIVSNAAFQWVSHHDILLARLAKMLAPGGTLAVQMPFHFENPAHLAIEETKADPRWRASLKGVGLHQKSVLPLMWYVERLHDLGFVVDAWQTIYIHVLMGENPVLEWFKGTALRPLLNRLGPDAKDEFLHELGSRFRTVYPAREGVTLLPFPRLFFVATRLSSFTRPNNLEST
jgi:trans-aconitate 2-methyltransferase